MYIRAHNKNTYLFKYLCVCLKREWRRDIERKREMKTVTERHGERKRKKAKERNRVTERVRK
jgi:hypothetical protein